MAHETTKEENYAGIIESGFTALTAGIDEIDEVFEDFSGERIDLTVLPNDDGIIDAEYFELDGEEGSIILRLGRGTKYLWNIDLFSDMPQIAKVYIPPTMLGEIGCTAYNKNLFVVPENYSYRKWDNVSFATYKTTETQFPAGNYTFFLEGESKTYTFVDFGEGEISEIASAMHSDPMSFDGEPPYNAVNGLQFNFKITNNDTGEEHTISCYPDCRDEWRESPTLVVCIDGEYIVNIPFIKEDVNLENYTLVVERGRTGTLSEIDLPNGFNLSDIKMNLVIVNGNDFENVPLINTWFSVCGNEADTDMSESWYESCVIGGETMDYDELPEFAGGGDGGSDEDDTDEDDDDPPPTPTPPPVPPTPTPPTPEPAPPSSANDPLAELKASLKASLDESKKDLQQQLQASRDELKKSLDDALKGLKI